MKNLFKILISIISIVLFLASCNPNNNLNQSKIVNNTEMDILPFCGQKFKRIVNIFETGNAGEQPGRNNLTDWNGQGGQKSPSNYIPIGSADLHCVPIPRNYVLENPKI